MTKDRPHLTRRAFLAQTGLAAAGALAGSSAFGAIQGILRRRAQDEDFDFVMPRVRFEVKEKVPDTWNISPGGE